MICSSRSGLRRARDWHSHGNSYRLLSSLSSTRGLPGNNSAPCPAATTTVPTAPNASNAAAAAVPSVRSSAVPPGPGLHDFIANIDRTKTSHSSSINSSGGMNAAMLAATAGSSEMSFPATLLEQPSSRSCGGNENPAAAARATSTTASTSPEEETTVGQGNNPDVAERGSFFIETYGCQMNVSDSEVVRAILLEAGFRESPSLEEAGVVLANTCAIREKAEGKVWDRLKFFSFIR